MSKGVKNYGTIKEKKSSEATLSSLSFIPDSLPEDPKKLDLR